MLEIKSTTTGERIQIAENDFEEKFMFSDEAKKAVCELGNGWRLPTITELEQIYNNLHKIGIGNFTGAYWSSTENQGTFPWYFNFYHGKAFPMNPHDFYPISARAVRDI
jgi:hypothetical protein